MEATFFIVEVFALVEQGGVSFFFLALGVYGDVTVVDAP